ncbi:hypothetical protein VTK56DRAFT_7699 [Thermocarpiscus australiensis]
MEHDDLYPFSVCIRSLGCVSCRPPSKGSRWSRLQAVLSDKSQAQAPCSLGRGSKVRQPVRAAWEANHLIDLAQNGELGTPYPRSFSLHRVQVAANRVINKGAAVNVRIIFAVLSAAEASAGRSRLNLRSMSRGKDLQWPGDLLLRLYKCIPSPHRLSSPPLPIRCASEARVL